MGPAAPGVSAGLRARVVAATRVSVVSAAPAVPAGTVGPAATAPTVRP
ncbi:hypothetical protein [Mycobacterium gordonae]|nr:hypothetical protein [Mycobacterium gordonae]